MSLEAANLHISNALAKKDINDILADNVLPANPDQFSIWQVETLLNQAQDLLERCMGERARYDDLRAKYLITCIDFLAEESELFLQEARVKEEKAGISWYQHGIQSLERDADRTYVSEADAPPGSPGWQKIMEMMTGARSASQNLREIVQSHSLAGEEYKTKRLHEREVKTVEAKEKQVLLAQADAERFDATVKYLRAIRNKKSDAITKPGGAFNYEERFTPLETQISADYTQAWGRVAAAYLGLKTLFGFEDQPKPPEVAPRAAGLPPPKVLENLIVWVRDAISWMVRFTHSDHSFSIVIPVKALVGDIEWKRALSDLQANGKSLLEFKWDGSRLDRYCFVRAAGISASYVSKDCDGVLQIDVAFPHFAISNHWTKTGPVKSKIEQKTLAPCRLGRVVNSLTPRPPDVAGAISQRNASPIGDPNLDGNWRFQIDVVSKRESDMRKISDIELELQLNAWPKLI